MINQATDLFFPEKIINSIQSESKRAEASYDARVQIYFNLILMLVCSLVFLFRLIFVEYENWSIYLLPLCVFLSFIACIVIQKTGRIKLAYVLYVATTMPILLIRIYYTGGIAAPAVLLVYILPIQGYLLGERMIPTVVSLVFISSVVMITFTNTPVFYNSKILRGLIYISIMAIGYFPMLNYVSSQKKLKEKIMQLERMSATESILERLSHEINNQIGIAELKVETLGDINRLSEIKDPLENISKLLTLMNHIKVEDDLGRVIQENQSVINFLDLQALYGKQS